MEKTLNENEDIQSVVPSAEQKPAANVNKLFNIVSLSYAAVLLAAEIFLLIAMFVGIIAVDGVTFNSPQIQYFVTILILRKFARGLSTLICLGLYSVFWLIVLVTVIVGTVRAIIGFIKFVKLDEEYESREARFGKYVRTVSRSYGNAIALIVGSLIVNSSFTAMGSGVVALGCIIYFASSAIVILFKDVFNKDKKLDLFAVIINAGKKLVMFMLALLLAANVKESFNVALENIFALKIAGFDSAKMVTGSIYFNMVKPLYYGCAPCCCVIAIVAYIMKYYPLNNGKKDVNALLKTSFITLLVFTLLFCVADCVIYGIAYGANSGGITNVITKDWLAFLFVSVAGIVLTYTRKTEKDVIRG